MIRSALQKAREMNIFFLKFFETLAKLRERFDKKQNAPANYATMSLFSVLF